MRTGSRSRLMFRCQRQKRACVSAAIICRRNLDCRCRGVINHARTDHASMAGEVQDPIHFKEDVLRVKRSRFRIVILSAAKDLCPARDPSLALRMTKPGGLFFEMYCPQGAPLYFTHQNKVDRWLVPCSGIYMIPGAAGNTLF